MQVMNVGLSGGSGSTSNYDIASLSGLENSAARLAKYNQEISNNASSLQYVVNAIRENWENEQGKDIESVMTNLNDAIKTLSEEIQPVITTYVESLNRIVTETRANQSKSLY